VRPNALDGAPHSSPGRVPAGCNTPRRGSPSHRPFGPGRSHADSARSATKPLNKNPAARRGRSAAHYCFPFNDFGPYFTLSSEYFSSFLHSTCSLSVFARYLAFDGIYHPLWSPVPRKPTLRKSAVRLCSGPTRGSHPLGRPVPRNLGPSFGWLHLLQTTIRRRVHGGDFHSELFPVQSPLLRESRLFSFPPLINMLKFSG
jgi:hypothetical protein